jgi:hypothetical protein
LPLGKDKRPLPIGLSDFKEVDVMLIPKNPQDLGVIFEFKKIGVSDDLATAALQQIEDRKYDLELQGRGVSRILHLGLAFQGKNVAIRSK